MHNPDCDVMDINPEGIRKPCNCGQAIPGWVGKDPFCSVCRRTATWAWAQEGKIAFAACDQHRKDVMRVNGLARPVQPGHDAHAAVDGS